MCLKREWEAFSRAMEILPPDPSEGKDAAEWYRFARLRARIQGRATIIVPVTPQKRGRFLGYLKRLNHLAINDSIFALFAMPI